ncbi:AAA family ATPase [Nocardia sp. 348MFTsu5.1]|uniref:AAA family ATPase n=1 Tax=Nocardia sp. 348MFTsu5.1 TaxID=1172185 RepID=UPI0003705FE5|nr:AAA family ATPase [Nocardia sp. 348MFTsu5.1]
MTTQRITRPLNVYDRFDLVKFVRRIDEMPPPPCALSDNPALVANWIRKIGPIETSDVTDLHQLMVNLLIENGSSVNGARQWLAIDGPPLVGKTLAVTAAALRIHDWLCDNQADDVAAPFEHIPVVIISGNLGDGKLARTLLDKIARFIGVPLPSRGGFAAALDCLEAAMRNVGTLLIVVDDAHFIKRSSGTRALTDHLKDIMTALPASFVFVGAGLQQSALLHVPSETVAPRSGREQSGSKVLTEGAFQRSQYSAVEQLRLRMQYFPMRPLPSGDRKQPDDRFIERMLSMIDQLDRVEGFDPKHLRTITALKQINARAGGRTGRGLKLIARIASLAADMGVSPTRAHVYAVTGMSDEEIDRG